MAQGIIAQVRILGGSLGIAASTAILGSSQRRNLSDLVTPAQLASLDSFAKTTSIEQLLAIRKTYSDAFSDDMKVAAVISGVAIFVAGLSFRREKVDVQERRKEKAIEERERLRAIAELTSNGVV